MVTAGGKNMGEIKNDANNDINESVNSKGGSDSGTCNPEGTRRWNLCRQV